MLKRILGIIIWTVPVTLFAQEKWGLRKCVDYALEHNISVKTADIQARIAALEAQQAKLNMWPTASFSGSAGAQFGRSIDPTSNQFTTTQLFYNQYQLQGGASIFNFGRLRFAQEASALNAQALLTDVERVKNDVSLNVASYYLNILAAQEQMNISQIQLDQTKAQYDVTKKKVDAGALPELNLAEIESQMASDSSNLIAARTTMEQNVLFLKALLNIDMAQPFDVDTPPVEMIPLEPISDLQPDYVYKLALTTNPQQKVNELYIQSAEKNIRSLKSYLYPSLSGFYGLNSTYNNKAQGVVGYQYLNPPIGKVDVNGTQYEVFPTQPYTQPIYGKTGYFKQLDQNFSQSIGISLNIPIFNNGAYKLNYQRAKLNFSNLQEQKAQADQTLQSNIYNAYASAIAALEKYNASIKSVESAQKAYDFATKRYEIGLLTTIDLLTNQNNLLKAKLQQLSNHYDYVFKMKVLEFYKGQGIKL